MEFLFTRQEKDVVSQNQNKPCVKKYEKNVQCEMRLGIKAYGIPTPLSSICDFQTLPILKLMDILCVPIWEHIGKFFSWSFINGRNSQITFF